MRDEMGRRKKGVLGRHEGNGRKGRLMKKNSKIKIGRNKEKVGRGVEKKERREEEKKDGRKEERKDKSKEG